MMKMKKRFFETGGNGLKSNLESMEMAKKRDYKVMIMDEAINKVPSIKYRHIPEDQHHIITELAKEALIVSKDENNSNEVAITYRMCDTSRLSEDQRRSVIGIALGDDHSVDPEEDTVSYHLLNATADCIVVIVHNHPSLSKISLADVRYLLRYHSLKMIVAVTNLGSITYVVKSESYDRTKAVDLYDKCVDMYNDADDLKGYQKATNYFLNNSNFAH